MRIPTDTQQLRKLNAGREARKREAAPKALDTTQFLLKSPRNAKRLLGSIAELEAGRGEAKSLAE